MNDSSRASYNCGGQVAFVFRLPAGQVEFSGLILTLFELYLYICLGLKLAFNNFQNITLSVITQFLGMQASTKLFTSIKCIRPSNKSA